MMGPPTRLATHSTTTFGITSGTSSYVFNFHFHSHPLSLSSLIDRTSVSPTQRTQISLSLYKSSFGPVKARISCLNLRIGPSPFLSLSHIATCSILINFLFIHSFFSLSIRIARGFSFFDLGFSFFFCLLLDYRLSD